LQEKTVQGELGHLRPEDIASIHRIEIPRSTRHSLKNVSVSSEKGLYLNLTHRSERQVQAGAFIWRGEGLSIWFDIAKGHCLAQMPAVGRMYRLPVLFDFAGWPF
jgi:hypothetical protein